MEIPSGNALILKQIELFKNYTNEELKKLLELAFVKDYTPGLTLFNEGMIGDVMYIIISGQVQVAKKNEKGESIVVATLHDGDFFGEMSLVENETRTAAAKITLPTKMLVITRRTFDRMLEVDPHMTSKLLMSFLKVMSHRLRATMKK